MNIQYITAFDEYVSMFSALSTQNKPSATDLSLPPDLQDAATTTQET